jgi:hypothetical protein
MPSEHVFIRDDFLTITPGEPIRLLPIGKLVKGGESRELTPEFLAKFRLPHFKPAIKRGSHEDNAPAVGWITGLEVRDDGLYAETEFSEKGEQALDDGDYRYHSPEVIWEGGMEDPGTGELIEGPLIVGDALLHMPHLGEAAALYVSEPFSNDGGNSMSEHTDLVETVSAMERLAQMFRSTPKEETDPQPTPPPAGVEADKYEALQQERDDMAAKLQQMEAQAAQDARIAHFAAELGDTTTPDVYEVLAGMDETEAGLLVEKFKALAAQVKASNLTTDIGHPGELEAQNPDEALNTAIMAKAAEAKVGYGEALALVRAETPDLFSHLKGGA